MEMTTVLFCFDKSSFGHNQLDKWGRVTCSVSPCLIAEAAETIHETHEMALRAFVLVSCDFVDRL